LKCLIESLLILEQIADSFGIGSAALQVQLGLEDYLARFAVEFPFDLPLVNSLNHLSTGLTNIVNVKEKILGRAAPTDWTTKHPQS